MTPPGRDTAARTATLGQITGSSSVEAQGIHHGITPNGFGAPSGEIFTPVSVLSTDLGVSVNS